MRAFRLHLPHHRLFFGLQLCANDLCKPLANRLLSRRGESACARRSRGGRPRRPGRRRHQHENAGAARHSHYCPADALLGSRENKKEQAP